MFLILDDTVVPGLPVDEVVELADIEPDAIDHMIARGLVPQMPTDAAKLYPDLFPIEEGCKKSIPPRPASDGTRARAARGWGHRLIETYL